MRSGHLIFAGTAVLAVVAVVRSYSPERAGEVPNGVGSCTSDLLEVQVKEHAPRATASSGFPVRHLADRLPDGGSRGALPRRQPVQPPPSIMILDPNEPEERIDIGRELDVDTAMENHDLVIEQFIGIPLDANDPLTLVADDSDGFSANLGEPLDADAPDSLSGDDNAVGPLLIGELRDADPVSDSLWQTEQSTYTSVRDIGPHLPVPDETTAPWPWPFD